MVPCVGCSVCLFSGPSRCTLPETASLYRSLPGMLCTASCAWTLASALRRCSAPSSLNVALLLSRSPCGRWFSSAGAWETPVEKHAHRHDTAHTRRNLRTLGRAPACELEHWLACTSTDTAIVNKRSTNNVPQQQSRGTRDTSNKTCKMIKTPEF